MTFAPDAFSQRFADRLAAAHPEWPSLAQADPDDGGLRVVVPSPVEGRTLLLRTYGTQVTIDFGPDGWHEHFLPQVHGSDAAAIDAALHFIDELLADRIVIATRYVLGVRLWSRAVHATTVRAPSIGATRIVSWSGTRDATLPVRKPPTAMQRSAD